MTVIQSARNDRSWFALVDAEHCRLFRCRATGHGTQQVDEQGALKNMLPEKVLPQPMTESDTIHQAEVRERYFARDVVQWLERQSGLHLMHRVMIFAPPRMLAALRKAPPGSLRGQLEEFQAELIRMEAVHLAEHPVIRDLVHYRHEA